MIRLEGVPESQPTVEILHQVTRICCFPFAIESNQEVLSAVQTLVCYFSRVLFIISYKCTLKFQVSASFYAIY